MASGLERHVTDEISAGRPKLVNLLSISLPVSVGRFHCCWIDLAFLIPLVVVTCLPVGNLSVFLAI